MLVKSQVQLLVKGVLESIRGQTPRDYRLLMRGVCYSAIRIFSNHRVNDIYITEESVNGETFLHFFHTVLLPTLNSFDG